MSPTLLCFMLTANMKADCYVSQVFKVLSRENSSKMLSVMWQVSQRFKFL